MNKDIKMEDLFPGLKEDEEKAKKQKVVDWLKNKYPGLFPQYARSQQK